MTRKNKMARDYFRPTLHKQTLLFISLLSFIKSSFTVDYLHAGVSCSAGPDMDVTNLTKGIWTFTQPNGKCIGNGSCTIQLGLCQKLSLDNCTDASACMNVTNQQKTIPYKLGSYVNNPFNLSKSKSGENLIADLKDGGNYTLKNKTNCSLSVEITFSCNLNVYWNWKADSTGKTTVPTNALTSARFDDNQCLYRLSFDYEGVCVKIQPPFVPNVETLSAGSVIVILFFVTISVYCLFGSGINFCRGYRGKDVIPQSEFWVTLPVLIADGFVFTFTCGRTGGDSAYDSI